MEPTKRAHYPIRQFADKNGNLMFGVVETPSMSVETDDITIPEGARSVTIITNSAFSGTILGVAAEASSVYTFSAQLGNYLAVISIEITAGSITILKSI